MEQRDSIRSLAAVAGILYLISWVFPVGAGLLGPRVAALPGWIGAADVGLALLVALSAWWMMARSNVLVDELVEARAYRTYRVWLHALMVVAVVAMVAGDRITWPNCAVGFLWRSWLGLYLLPWWLAAMGTQR